MAHGGAWYVKPDKNVAPSGTPTWAVGTANADFPLANVETLEPDVVAKANENTATLRITFGAPVTLVGLAAFNVNFPGVTVGLTNNGGMATQNRTVPAPEDNLMINVFWDLEGVAGTTASQWNIPVVGAAPVTIGTVVAITEWGEFRMRWGYHDLERFPVIEHRTGYQKRLQFRIPVRYRVFRGTPFLAADVAAERTLRRLCNGSITPFVFVKDRNASDVRLVQFADDEHSETTEFIDGTDSFETGGVVEREIRLEEVSGGVSLL
jgi:hypothetical protein